jgi:DNA mismatch endonuclease (patch repair protein)
VWSSTVKRILREEGIKEDEIKSNIRNGQRKILSRLRTEEWRRGKWKHPKEDTSIEVKIQNLLKKLHIEFFTHYHISEILDSYRADIFIPEQNGIKQKTILECDGCYWHGCPVCKSTHHYLSKKQKERDELRTKQLQEKGYRVIRLWDHEIKNMEINELRNKIW